MKYCLFSRTGEKEEIGIFEITDEISPHNYNEIRNYIVEYVDDERIETIWIDLSKVDFITSSGIGMFFDIYKRMLMNKQFLLFMNISNYSKKIFHQMGLYRIFPVADDFLDSMYQFERWKKVKFLEINT